MTARQIRKDLQDIRFYYMHKEMFAIAENTGFKSEVGRKTNNTCSSYPKLRRGYMYSIIYYM